jgi:hypothetical protein
MKQIPFKTLVRLLLQANEAYCNDGPDYIRQRMIVLVHEIRAWCDDVEHLLEYGAEDRDRDEATV